MPKSYMLGPVLVLCGLLSHATSSVAERSTDSSVPSDAMTIEEGLANIRFQSNTLRTFIARMPKGADLHNHLSGAVTMERLIAWGAEDGVCINTSTFVASRPPCSTGQVPLANALSDKALYQQVLGAWSMLGAPKDLLGAHQHFFDSFGKFGAVLSDDRIDDALADILSTAGKNKQIYVELMQGLGSSAIGAIARNYIFPGDPWDEAYLLEKRAQLIADPLFSQTLEVNRAFIKSSIASARQILGCGSSRPDPGCDVEMRYILSANRTRDRGSVFAQWVYAYELAQVAPEVVGVNLVSPEEHPNSLLYYDDEMTALDVLRRFNMDTPNRKPVHISLHAGELIPDILPNTPEGQRHLTFHIRHAVEIAHAERIGHGSDLFDELAADGGENLLQTLRKQNVAIEACLTSNGVLLGKVGRKHPIRTYIRNKVPTALATDDQGIFRINITDEYVKAYSEQRLGYNALKNLARESIEHSFLPGESLWQTPNRYDRKVSACRSDDSSTNKPSTECANWLSHSERATMQNKLEMQFVEFERGLRRSPPRDDMTSD